MGDYIRLNVLLITNSMNKYITSYVFDYKLLLLQFVKWEMEKRSKKSILRDCKLCKNPVDIIRHK